MLRRYRPLLLLLALGAGYLAPTVGRFSSLLDEGLVLSPADRLAQGQMPYRDFYLFTTPGPVLLMGLGFRLFGTSLEVAHGLLLAVKLATLGALYLVGRYLLSPRWALAPPLAFLLLYMAEPMNYANHWIPNLPYLLGLAAALALLRQPAPWRAAALGAWVVITGLTLQTFGVALAVTAAVALGETRRPRLWLASLGAGLALGLPYLGWLAATGTLEQFFRDTVGSNLHRSGLERVSLGGFLGSLWATHGPGCAWPFALTGLLLVLTHLVGLLGPLPAWRQSATLRVTLVAAWMLLAACSYRLLPSQLLLHGFLPLVLTAWRLQHWGRPGRLAGGLLAAGFLAVGGWSYAQALRASYAVEFPRGQARVASAREAQELQALVRFLQKRTPTRRAFFTPYEPNLYFLMGLENPTRYFQMRPLQYSRDQMLEALGRLEDCPVFRFPAYESDAFLRWGWPDLDLEPYREQEAWFYEQLERTHRFEDCGAVQVYFSDR